MSAGRNEDVLLKIPQSDHHVRPAPDRFLPFQLLVTTLLMSSVFIVAPC